MRCFVHLVAICVAGVLYVQGQPGDVRKPDFTISNASTNESGAIAYSADGRLLAAAFEHVIKIYNMHQGDPFSLELSQTLANSSVIQAMTFRDSNILVSLAVDGSVRTWNATSGRMLHRTSLDSADFTVSIFASNQPLLATATRNRVTLCNYQTGKSLNAFETTDSTVSALAFTPDGKLLAVGTRKGVVRVFDVAIRKITRTIDLDSPISALSASANYIVLGYTDGTLALLSFGGQSSTHELSGHTEAITALAFSPQGERFASGSIDGTIKIWSAESQKLLASLKASAAAIPAITFSEDGKVLISNSTDGTIDGWRLAPTQ